MIAQTLNNEIMILMREKKKYSFPSLLNRFSHNGRGQIESALEELIADDKLRYETELGIVFVRLMEKK